MSDAAALADPEDVEPVVLMTPAALRTPLGLALADLARASLDDEPMGFDPSHGRKGLRICLEARDVPAGRAGRIAVVVGDPGAAVRRLVQTEDMALTDALRLISGQFAEAAGLVNQTAAFTFTEQQFLDAPAQSLCALITQLDLHPPPEVLGAAAAAFARAVRACARPADEKDAFGVDAALAAHARLPLTKGASAFWRRDLFFGGDTPDKACAPSIDITGNGRILVYGPYIRLAPGRWSAEVAFEVCAHAARRTFHVEFVAGDSLTQVKFQPSAAGGCLVKVGCSISQATPVELRVAVSRAAFHGELRFLGATVRYEGGLEEPGQ